MDFIDRFRGGDIFFPDAESFLGPGKARILDKPKALQVPAEELTMWVGVKPARTSSAAATAWMTALQPPPQKTKRMFPYLSRTRSDMECLRPWIPKTPGSFRHTRQVVLPSASAWD